MPLLVTSVPNLAQGVSQQPDNLRFPGQCDEQINAWATVVEGLVKRPNTEYIKNIQKTGDKSDLFTHFVKRDEKNKYVVTVSLGGIGAINLANGTNVSVAVTSIASSYLSLGTAASLGGVANPLVDLKALTVADYTFLVNKNRTVGEDTDSGQKSDRPADEALVVVKLGDYEKAYSVYIEDELVPNIFSTSSHHHHNHTGHTPSTYISGPSSGTSPGKHADTEYIARDLESCLSAYLSGVTLNAVSGITITNGGTGWLDERSSGWLTSPKLGTFPPKYKQTQYKLVGYLTDASSASPRLRRGTVDLKVVNGVITEATIDKKGLNLSANPGDVRILPEDIIVYQRSRYADKKPNGGRGSWKKWYGWKQAKGQFVPAPFSGFSYPELRGTAPSFTITVSPRQPFKVVRKGSVIKIRSEDGPFKIRVEDGLSNQGLSVVNREVNSITDLPASCFHDFKVKVRGDADIAQDDYYVEFQTRDGEDVVSLGTVSLGNISNFGRGSWVETVGWNATDIAVSIAGINTELLATTMPVTLVPYFNTENKVSDFTLQSPHEPLYAKHNGDFYLLTQDHTSSSITEPGVGANYADYWTPTVSLAQGCLQWKQGVFYYGPTTDTSELGWSPRLAGDDATNPFPSLVGNKINDVFFFKNRLGLLSDSSVVFSEADNYFNFFRTTTQQLLDSAPIDVGLSHTKVAVLKHAIPFQEKLMLFSQNSQFVLRGADVLSPKTVAISPVTEYDISDNVNPVAVGSFIYFPFKRQQFEGLYEYFIDNNTEVFEATEITSQVPKYIPSGVTHLVGSNAENLIVCRSSYEPKSLYVYKYFWQNKEKIQSAWMKFTYNRNIRGFDFIDSNLYVLAEDSNALHLEKATMESGLTDTGLDYRLLLDSRVDGKDVTVSLYNPATKVTRVTDIPFNVSIASPSAEIYTKIGTQRATTVVDSSTIDISGAVGSYVDDGLGDYVTYNGSTYYCKTAHTSTSTFELKHWTEVSSVPSYGSSSEWTASTAYSKGTIYKCVHSDDTIQAHTSTPATRPGSGGVSGDYWQTSTDFSSATLWEAGRLYNDDTYFFIGIPYDMLYRFSNQILKQPTERGGRSASDYTFQTIRNASVEYADTGHFTVEVTPKYRDTYSYAFNPEIVGANLTLDVFEPKTGHFRFPVQSRPNDATIEIKSSSALPVKLLAAEFESLVSARSKRYGG